MQWCSAKHVKRGDKSPRVDLRPRTCDYLSRDCDALTTHYCTLHYSLLTPHERTTCTSAHSSLLTYPLYLRRVKVLWCDRADTDEWYAGTIAAYCAANEEHLVLYDDGDSKWHTLQQEERLGTLSWIDPPMFRQRVGYEDSNPHYLVYNADTRMLNTYPNMLVLEDLDVTDPTAFAQKLADAPYHMYVPCDVELVRQVFVKVSDARCMDVPHACSKQVQKLATRKM